MLTANYASDGRSEHFQDTAELAGVADSAVSPDGYAELSDP